MGEVNGLPALGSASDGSLAFLLCATMMLRLCQLSMLPSVRTSRCPFTAPSSPASTFSATHGVRYPFARNFSPVNVKSGALDQLIWHWLHVSPVCRTNAGTRADATFATITSAANATVTLSHRIVASLATRELQFEPNTTSSTHYFFIDKAFFPPPSN